MYEVYISSKREAKARALRRELESSSGITQTLNIKKQVKR